MIERKTPSRGLALLCLDGVITHMSEGVMTVGAATIELGIPLLAIIALVRVPRLRRFAVVLLGAVTPAVVFYGLVVVTYLINPSSQSNIFSFYAAWVMTFLAYVTLLVIGGALAFLPKPSNLYARFFVGFAATPLTLLLLKFV